MGKPFKNLGNPTSNTNAPAKEPTLTKDPPAADRTTNGEPVNPKLGHEGAIPWPAVEKTKPMRLKNGG